VDGTFQQTGTQANCAAVGVQRKKEVAACEKRPGVPLRAFSSSALSLIQLAAFDLLILKNKVPAAEQPKIISLP
jgi:hypothetical protein